MKVNFKKIVVQTSFEGDKAEFDVAKVLGNEMMFNNSVLLDIEFEDLAKAIYYSEEEVEVSENYIPAIIQVVRNSSFMATIKREIINQLNKK